MHIPIPVLPTDEELRPWAESHLVHGRPFRIDAWPAALRARAGTLVETFLSAIERDALITVWAGLADNQAGTPEIEQAEEVTRQLSDRIQTAVDFWEAGAFVRLNTRSPKDNFEWLDDEGKPRPIHSGRQAIATVCGSMERMYEDLNAAKLLSDQPVAIVIRPYFTFESWREVRVFIEDRTLVGISQYFYHHSYPELIERYAAWEKPLQVQVAQIMDEAPWPSFTLDGWVEDDGTFRFLEVNPPLSAGVTDPALFRDGKLDGTFRVRSRQPVPLPPL
jgi:hypothetical protein